MSASQSLPPDEPEEYPRLDELRVLLVAPHSPPIGGMTVQADQLASHLRAERAMVVRVASNPPVPFPLEEIPNVRGAWRMLKFRRALCRAIADGADVLHVHSASWQYFHRITAFALREAHDAGMRTVLRWDGGEADDFFTEEGDRVFPYLKYADEVVVPSGYLGEIFRRHFTVLPRVIPNLIQAPAGDRVKLRDAGPLRLLCHRHLEPTYGVEVVVRAVADARSRGADARLVVAGGGSESERLRELAQEVCPGAVSFLGAVPHEQVIAVLRETDVVVNGSFSDNFPVALAEAHALGVPVVTTRAGGIPWVVEDEQTGLLVDTGDVAAMSRAIRRLHDDRKLLARMGDAAADRARAWTWSSVRSAWTDAYVGRPS